MVRYDDAEDDDVVVDSSSARTRYHHIAAGNLGRLAAITDGVFAITMTLLVLDLTVPEAFGSNRQRPLWSPGELQSERELLHALAHIAPSILTYLMSFLTLGMFWVGAQTLLNHLERTDRHFTWIQLAFLLGTAFMPFTTALLGEFITYRTPLILYWLNLLLLGTLLFCSLRYAKHAKLLTEAATPEMQKAFERRLIIPQALYVVAAALCVVNTYVSIALFVILQLNSAIAPNIRPLNRF